MRHKGLIIFTSLVLVAAVAGSVLPLSGEVRLYDKLVRLHVIANSDSETDQELKLKVRDAVLAYTKEIMEGCADASEAVAAAEKSAEGIRDVCVKTLSAEGCDLPVSVVTGIEKYPEKTYNTVRLPSGDYYSVRVMIGEAAGHNWWCVLFPPLCVGAASDDRAVMAAAGLTKDEVDILTDNGGDKYVLKFRIIEFFRRAFSDN